MWHWNEGESEAGNQAPDVVGEDATAVPGPASRPPVRFERGRDAAESLMRVAGDDLLRVMLRRTFHAIDDAATVPVIPCPHCLDGGLRLAGTLRDRTGGRLVRGCDTCGAVVVGDMRIDRGHGAAPRRYA
jgi:hypothetical protein